MSNPMGVPVENINAGTVRLKRFPVGRMFWYYMEVKGVSVRIDKNLYKTIKRIVRDE